MNEQLQDKMVEILTAMQEAAKAGGDFAMSQLPDIAQQYVLYGRVWGTVAAILMAALAVVFACIAIRAYRASDHQDDPGPIILMMISSILSFLFAIFTILSLRSAFLVWIAPKVWLIKEIAGLLK